jgi:hypothetical protein
VVGWARLRGLDLILCYGVSRNALYLSDDRRIDAPERRLDTGASSELKVKA